MEICDQHKLMVQQLLDHQEFVGRTEQKLDSACKSIVRINEKIGEIRDAMVQHKDAISELKKCVANGATTATERYANTEARAKQSTEESVPGFAGSLNRAFNKIRDNFALYLLLGGAILVAWVVMQKTFLWLGWRIYF